MSILRPQNIDLPSETNKTNFIDELKHHQSAENNRPPGFLLDISSEHTFFFQTGLNTLTLHRLRFFLVLLLIFFLFHLVSRSLKNFQIYQERNVMDAITSHFA